MISKDKLARALNNAGVVIHEPVRLRNGEVSKYYADIKMAYGNPELLAEMAKATIEDLDPRTTCVAASGYGGMPLATAISILKGIPLTMVRDTPKNHGEEGVFFDGYVPKSADFVSIVDDVFTSGRSLRFAKERLGSTGAQVVGCHVIVARGDTTQFDIPVSYLMTTEAIIAQN